MAVLNRPGTAVTLRTTPSNVAIATDTGVAFISGLTDRGPLTPKAVYNLDQFVSIFGDRQTYSPMYDWLDVFFREGGYKCYVSRVVGPSATTGFLNLLDGAAAIALVASAIGPGAWSNQYKVSVSAGVAGGTFVIRVLDINNNILEDSGDLLDNNAAVQWGQYSNYIRIALGASANDPAVLAATVLSAGNDDRNNAVDANWLNALNQFAKDLGPGQVCFPGRTTDTAHGQLLAHEQANGRVALLDLPDTATVGTLQASAAAARDKSVACYTPWQIYPAAAGTVGASRTVPPSALVAALCARNDAALGANHPAAGRFGQSRYAYDVSQPAFSDAVRNTLNASGVNVIRNINGVVEVFGWRANTTDTNWTGFGNARLFMSLSARLDEVAQNYLFEEIDGQNGQTITAFHDDIAGVLMEFYNEHQLFGDTPADAFTVDTGPGVNTLATIAANELHAVVAVRMAPMAELVQIEVVKRAVTEAV